MFKFIPTHVTKSGLKVMLLSVSTDFAVSEVQKEDGKIVNLPSSFLTEIEKKKKWWKTALEVISSILTIAGTVKKLK